LEGRDSNVHQHAIKRPGQLVEVAKVERSKIEPARIGSGQRGGTGGGLRITVKGEYPSARAMGEESGGMTPAAKSAV
jgi:hypothetical protein